MPTEVAPTASLRRCDDHQRWPSSTMSCRVRGGSVPADDPMSVRAVWRPAVDRWMADHQGVIAVPQAIALGAPRRAIARAVATGELIQVLPGVVRSRDWPFGRRQLMAAALARNPRAVLAFLT